MTKISSSVIASLAWYDDANTSRNLNELWYAIADILRASNGVSVAPELVRDRSVRSLWQCPQLVLGQCCGPDLFTADGSHLEVIARPVFADLDCTQGNYRSHIVSRTASLRGPVRLAVNSMSSRSGCAALVEWVQSRKLTIQSVVVSGSHRNSLTMLEAGRADLVAIDSHSVNACGIELKSPIVGRSQEAMSPPFVCHKQNGVSRDILYDALHHGIREKGGGVGIRGILRCQRRDYQRSGLQSLASSRSVMAQLVNRREPPA